MTRDYCTKGIQLVVEYFEVTIKWHVWDEDGGWCFLYLNNLDKQPYPIHVCPMPQYGNILIYREDVDPVTIGIDSDENEIYDAIWDMQDSDTEQ